MKLLCKNVSEKTRSEFFGRLGMVAAIGILFVFLGALSFAWFSHNLNSGGSGMDIRVHTKGYDLLVERTATYESGYPVITSEGRTKDKLSALNYSLTATATSDSPKIAYELVNEYMYVEDDEEKYNLMPGAFGTLTFYLRPASDAPLNLTFTLSFGGYVTVYAAGEDRWYFNAVAEDATVLTLLKGHIMFFTERTGNTFEDYVYGGLIDDGTFAYSTLGRTKCLEQGKTDCYKITLYWEWPLTYYDIIEEISDTNTVRRFPPAMSTYIENTAYFFINTPSESDDEDDMALYYNDADQAIGSGIDAVIVYITV